MGLTRGDRVAVFLSQSLELPIAHLAAFRSGLVSIPLFTLFGEDALEFRLSNSGAKAVVTDESGWEKLAKIRDRLPDLKNVYVIGDARRAGAKSFWAVDRGGLRRVRDRRYLLRRSRASSSTPRAPREIRRARCTRIACCSAICPMSRWCHDFLPQARRPDVDAGRLGLDRRAVRRAVSRPGITACRSSAIARASSSRRPRCR